MLDYLFPKTLDDALIYAHWSYRGKDQPKYVAPSGVSNNIHQILLAFEPCSLDDRINAYRTAIKTHAMFGYTLSRAEYDHVLNLLQKAIKEMHPKANAWYPAEAFKNVGIISPVIAIYKYWNAEQDSFIFTIKSMRDFEYSRDCILGETHRVVLCMHVAPQQLVQMYTSQPEIIAHDGARDLPF
jgi:hypothetical protein